jgi:hypothetical protein
MGLGAKSGREFSPLFIIIVSNKMWLAICQFYSLDNVLEESIYWQATGIDT